MKHNEASANLQGFFSILLVPKWIYLSNVLIMYDNMSDFLAFSMFLNPNYFTRIPMYSGRKTVTVVAQRVCEMVKKRNQIQTVSSKRQPWVGSTCRPVVQCL